MIEFTLKLQLQNLGLGSYELFDLIDRILGSLFPVYSFEKRMRFKFLISIWTITKSFIILFDQELFDKILKSFLLLSYLSSFFWVKYFNLSVEDFAPNHALALVKEG